LFNFVEACRGGPLTLLLDYDGTLVPIAPTPEQATPDRDLVSLLGALARRRDREIHIVSGRPREVIARWFGDLPISLWAEHGFWSRPFDWAQGEPFESHSVARGRPRQGEWRAAGRVPVKALERTHELLERFTRVVPGSFIEEKSASLAWHFRRAQPRVDRAQAREFLETLENALAGSPLEVLPGKKVMEVRPRGVNKAEVGRRVLKARRRAAPIVAIGDDETDEDMFAALPDSAVTIAVGPGPTCAKYVVDDHLAARSLLAALLD
jgi:trehalose 6-phosphate synthase/phosphatase